MPENDALDVGQPDAGALEFIIIVQALKRTKQFVGIFRVETSAIVADVNHRLAFTAGSLTDFNSGFGAMAGELHRIGHQINQHHSQQRAVGAHRWQGLDFPRDIPLFRLRLKIAHGIPHQFVEVDIRLYQFRASDLPSELPTG